MNEPPPETVNVAVTDRAWVIDTTHVDDVPEHTPPQPENVDPVLAAAVNVTSVPWVNVSEQSPGQLIPEPVTEPVPEPDTEPDS